MVVRAAFMRAVQSGEAERAEARPWTPPRPHVSTAQEGCVHAHGTHTHTHTHIARHTGPDLDAMERGPELVGDALQELVFEIVGGLVPSSAAVSPGHQLPRARVGGGADLQLSLREHQR